MIRISSCLILIYIFCNYNLVAQSVDKIEPPFWWVRMSNPNVQLMLYGETIGGLDVESPAHGLEVIKVHRAENKNYLFVDLLIKNNEEAAAYPIQLKRKNKTIVTFDYQLLDRSPNSANRKGNSTADAIYLITPDRFANGNQENDEVKGLQEGLDRSLEYGRHGGDLQGISDHLEYLKELGFTAIWLNPVLENDQDKWSYHGYATTDYYKVDARLGTNEEYVATVKKARQMGIGVIMDIIVNHCGSFHWWMKDPPFNNWLNNQDGPYQETNHRKFTLLDPYTSKADRKIMTEGWFVPAMPDLNQRNEFMKTYLIQNSIWWIEYSGITGIRQDTYSYPFREFMTDWTCAIMNEYPNFYIVGEEWVDDPSLISYWQKDKVNKDGYNSCLPALMDFPLCFALHKAMNEDDKIWGNGLIKLYEKLGQDFNYANPSNLVIFPDNHDMSRIYTQVNENFDLYKMALTFILTTRGIPQLYYGTEIAMGNKGTDSHGIIRSDFPGGWLGDTVSAKDNVGLDSLQLAALSFNKNLLKWRKDKTVIHNGKLMHFEPREKVYVYFRYDDDECVMVILNKNEATYHLKLDRFDERLGVFSNAFLIAKDVLSEQEFTLKDSIALKPMQSYVLELKK